MTAFQGMTDRDLCTALDLKIGALAAKDRDFARSLIDSVRARVGAATPKQRHWLETLLDRAVNGAVERVKTQVGDFGGIAALFDRAAKKLKAPAIVIGAGGREVRLSVAGARARVPGSINVVDEVENRLGERPWYGRILATGEFEASPRERTPEGLLEGLARFAASPAEVAADHGRLTGRCCFCNGPLKDERSTAVGYGPVCARNFGLAWGARLADTPLLESAA
jgi:hypothetical protein